MIVAIRYCAAVCKRARTRGRSIGRNTPPTSGRPSDVTLRITTRAPYPRKEVHPSYPPANAAGLAVSFAGFGRGPPFGRLSALPGDQAEIPPRLEGAVGVDAPEGFLADLRAQLAAPAHGAV